MSYTNYSQVKIGDYIQLDCKRYENDFCALLYKIIEKHNRKKITLMFVNVVGNMSRCIERPKKLFREIKYEDIRRKYNN